MRSKEATEGSRAMLRCELSKAAPVEWRKGPETLRAGDRVSLRQDGAVCELEIRDLTLTDTGEYSCVCGQERTSATLTVRGKKLHEASWGLIWALSFLPCLLHTYCVLNGTQLFPALIHFPLPLSAFCYWVVPDLVSRY